MSESSGVKFDERKPAMDLVPWKAVRASAEVMGYGRDKYEAHNWRKGLAASRLSAAALRHLTAWISGEDLDPESGLSHLSHASCCVLMLHETVMDRPDLDDRYKPDE